MALALPMVLARATQGKKPIGLLSKREMIGRCRPRGLVTEVESEPHVPSRSPLIPDQEAYAHTHSDFGPVTDALDLRFRISLGPDSE